MKEKNVEIKYSKVKIMSFIHKDFMTGINKDFHTYEPYFIHTVVNGEERNFASDDEFLIEVGGFNIGLMYEHDVEPSEHTRKLVEYELFLKKK